MYLEYKLSHLLAKYPTGIQNIKAYDATSSDDKKVLNSIVSFSKEKIDVDFFNLSSKLSPTHFTFFRADPTISPISNEATLKEINLKGRIEITTASKPLIPEVSDSESIPILPKPRTP